VFTLKALTSRRLTLLIAATTVVLILLLLLLYRSGRLRDFAFWVAVSQFVLLLMGVLTAVYNDWVGKHRLLVLSFFAVAGVLALVCTVKQSDRSAAESQAASQAVQDGLARIEKIASKPDANKDDLLAEIRKVQGTVSSSQRVNASSPTASVSPHQLSGQPLQSPTPIQSFVYARFLGGDKNPLGRRKTFKTYHNDVRSEIEFDAHFSVRYGDHRPRVEIYIPGTRGPEMGAAVIFYVIEHYAEIKRMLEEESEFTNLQTSNLLTLYPDFLMNRNQIMFFVNKASQSNLLLQVVWVKEHGKGNEPNPFEP